MSELRPLSKVCVTITDGTHYTPKDVGNGIPFLTVKDMTPSGLDFQNCSQISRDDFLIAKQGNSAPKAGDVLFSKDGTVGKVQLVTSDNEFAVLSSIAILRPDSSQLYAPYLAHALRSEGILNSALKKKTGSAIRRIILSDLKTISIPLPPLAEQQRIAAILDKAEEIRRKREQAIDKLDELAQSSFVEMFGDPILNTRGFPTETVNNLCRLVRGSSPRPQGDPKYFGGPIPRLMVADLTRDGWLVTPKIDSLTEEGALKSRPVKAGTVVMAVSGNIGLVSRLAVDACIHDGFVGFTELNDRRCSPMYLLALLHLSKTAHDKNKAGAIFINLKTDDIKAMQLPIPPLELQNEFEQRLIKIDRQKKKIKQSAEILNRFNQSLQHQAFTTGFRA